jgi:hypothetical protein
MKVASLILGVVGSLAVVFLGILWVGQYKELERSELYRSVREQRQQGQADPELDKAFATVERTANAGYASFALGLVALVGAVLVFKLPRVSAGLMAAAVVVPAVLNPKSLAFSFVLLIAAALAFKVKPRQAAVASALAAAFLLAACGSGETATPAARAGSAAAPAAAASPAAAELYSCDKKAKMGRCTEYSGDSLVLGADFVKGSCDAMEGAFAQQACPKEGRLGTCELKAGTVTVYYPSAGNPDAEAAKKDCVDIYTGKWAGAK